MGYKYKNGIAKPDEYGCVRMEKFNQIMSMPRSRNKAERGDGDLYNAETLINLLFDKNNTVACGAMTTLAKLSEQSDEVCAYMDTFAEMLKSGNSYVRNRGLKLIAANARWDDENRFDAILNDYLTHVIDEKPITARQCIKALEEVGKAKPQYIPKIISYLHSADLSKYKDSMRPLIEQDIAETEKALTL